MTATTKAIIWAAIIIAAAFVARASDLSGGAYFGIIAGLSGAAWGTLQSRAGCTRGCSR